MRLNLNKNTDIFIPDSSKAINALERTTHLCIAAHQDDAEIFAWHGIRECIDSEEKWFTAVIVTNGAGSSRTGKYKDYTDQQMAETRHEEQRKAAVIGNYSAVIQLLHPSSKVKSGDRVIIDELENILKIARPETLYLHNPADKHDTHVAVLLRSIEALRRLPMNERPELVLGCEVWRSLDWVNNSEKYILPTKGDEALASEILAVFDSQISGGKRYDLATTGRRLSNATFYESHDTDAFSSITYAVDLTPLIKDDKMCISNFTENYIDSFKSDVLERIERFKS